jgi:hypothetical protein
MFIPDPDFYPSRIPDPGSPRIPDLGSRIQKQQQKRGVKKICCHTFFVATNFTKQKIILFLNAEEQILASFQKIIELFTPKIVTKLSKYGFGIRDPGSGKNLFRIPDPGPGVKKAPDPGYRIRIRNTASK